jgi:LDH2 family malate/lactate/ureidoglycolate dehydrogenase
MAACETPSARRPGYRDDGCRDAKGASRGQRARGTHLRSDGAPNHRPGRIHRRRFPRAAGQSPRPHKGFGLALFIDALGGVLSGAGFAQGVAGGAAGNFLWALDVESFLPGEDFIERMDAQIDQVKQGERAEGVDELWFRESAGSGATCTSRRVVSCR